MKDANQALFYTYNAPDRAVASFDSFVLANEIPTHAKFQSLCNLSASSQLVAKMLVFIDAFQKVLSLLSAAPDEAASEQPKAEFLLNISLGLRDVFCESILDASIELLCLVLSLRKTFKTGLKELDSALLILKSLDSSLLDLAASLEA